MLEKKYQIKKAESDLNELKKQKIKQSLKSNKNNIRIN